MSDEAIARFWAFWAEVSDTVAFAFSGRQGLNRDLVARIADHVHAIHPSLDWEFGPGRRSQHHLCLSGKGNLRLRAVAERWLASAPPSDATWEFYAARQPHRSPGLKLSIGGHDVALDDVVVDATLDEDRELFAVQVHHPAFRELVDAELRARIAFIALDTLLGEEAVERWLKVSLAAVPPRAGISLAELREKVEALAATATGERWVVMRGERDDRPVFVTWNLATKRAAHVRFDTHAEVTIELEAPSDQGLTTDAEAEALDTIEHDLVERLGDAALYLGRETWNGRRVLHLHTTDAAWPTFEAWRRAQKGRRIKLELASDPQWEILRRFG